MSRPLVGFRALHIFPKLDLVEIDLSGGLRQDKIPALGIPTGPIAQRLEQATHNRLVAGSNPAGPTTSHHLRFRRVMREHSAHLSRFVELHNLRRRTPSRPFILHQHASRATVNVLRNKLQIRILHQRP